jgi:hypothetical protein
LAAYVSFSVVRVQPSNGAFAPEGFQDSDAILIIIIIIG